MAANEMDLDSREYLDIKKSFKMKEKTTNVTFLKIGIGVAACAAVVLKFRKRFI